MKFDLRSAGVGALLGALVASGVTATVQRARDERRGAHSSSDTAPSATVETHATSSGDAGTEPPESSPWVTANVRLTEDIAEYRRSLEANEAERRDLAQKLAASEARLAALGDAAAPERSPFDLDKSDWTRMSKDGELRYRIPCARKTPWTPDAKTLQALGLRPDDAAPIREAYRRSNERMWSAVRPLCAKILGSEALADRLGTRVCTRVIEGTVAEESEESALARAKRVGEVRAGMRPEPGPADVDPMEALLGAETAEITHFEADLASSFGPEEAHRIAFDDALCAQDSRTGHPTVHH